MVYVSEKIGGSPSSFCNTKQSCEVLVKKNNNLKGLCKNSFCLQWSCLISVQAKKTCFAKSKHKDQILLFALSTPRVALR